VSDPDFATPPLTIDTICLADLRELEDRARRADDVDLLFHAQIAQDHLVQYRSGQDWYDGAINVCIAALNEQQAVIDAAFVKADRLVQELLAERNSFAERKSWRGVLVGGRS